MMTTVYDVASTGDTGRWGMCLSVMALKPSSSATSESRPPAAAALLRPARPPLPAALPDVSPDGAEVANGRAAKAVSQRACAAAQDRRHTPALYAGVAPCPTAVNAAQLSGWCPVVAVSPGAGGRGCTIAMSTRWSWLMSEGSACRSGAEAMNAFDRAASCAAPPMDVTDDGADINRESRTGARERDMTDTRRRGAGRRIVFRI